MRISSTKVKLFLVSATSIIVLCMGFLMVFDPQRTAGIGQTFRFWIFLAGMLAFSGLVFFDFMLDRKTSAAIQELREVVQCVRAGDLSRRISRTGSDDVGQCGAEINSLMESLEADLAQLKKLEHLRSEFLGNVSHELRTPIFSLQGMIETLLNGAIDGSAVDRESLEKALRNSDRLSSLLNGLIDVSRIESGEMKLQYRYFNAAEFLRTCIAEMESQTQLAGITLRSEISLEEGTEMYGDRDRLRQVMKNLIENAIRYSGEGKGVTVIASEREKLVEISVVDEGIGIEEEHLSQIFERFYRVDKVRPTTGGGTGLGLAIVKHILEAHRSFITVKSEPGKGSSFTFAINK
ncbi:MAG: ATP-binding protein [Ignavibacteriales bacterium]|nr:ATP-binding protein [Ignavibacteriales bacterium]